MKLNLSLDEQTMEIELSDELVHEFADYYYPINQSTLSIFCMQLAPENRQKLKDLLFTGKNCALPAASILHAELKKAIRTARQSKEC